eukprot:Phypoly_transcript_10267.p1 GENE.Phypoly_transcript_10267~~Phypoly_transcript_10267.p1  ORF type:complete len:348 (-),score=71.58 Phypoly_transcript_10267:8-1051(-)
MHWSKKLTGSVSLKVTEIQRYFFANPGDLHVLSSMTFGGSSLAENFSSEVEWIVRTLPNSHSEVKCNVKTEYKGFMFKGLIEKYVHQAACDSFHHWLQAVREKIEVLQEQENNADQNVPNEPYIPPSVSPVPQEDDDDDDEGDIFYDSLEMAPPPPSTLHPPLPSSSYSSPSSSSLPSSPIVQHQESPRTSPPLTATLPPPYTTNSHHHVIFTAYSAGRPALTQPRALLPPASFSPPSLHSSAPISSFSVQKPQQVRGWEAASDAERREVEDYKQRFTQMVAQTREREREWDERLRRMTQKLDAHARRTRWFLVFIASFAVVWPGLARAILRLLTWLWPLVRNRLRK